MDILITHFLKIKNELILSTIALAKGAQIIEKHVCIKSKSKPPDYISALEFKNFNKYISEINQIFSIFQKFI